MPEQKAGENPRPSAPPPRRSYPPLAENVSIPPAQLEARVRAALKEGNADAVADMGSSAKPALFKILENQKEEHFLRLAAAESLLEICGDSMRAYELVLALVIKGDVQEISRLAADAVSPLLFVLKNGGEMLELRCLCVEALVSISLRRENSNTLLSTVARLSSLLANAREAAVLRANIAFALVDLHAVCDDAKCKMIRSSLESAAKSEDEKVSRLADHALELFTQKEIERALDEGEPTIRLPK